MATFYPGLAVNAAEEARDAKAAIDVVKLGLEQELRELKAQHASIKKAKPTRLVCVSPGAGQQTVCVPGKGAKGALAKAREERRKVEHQFATAIKAIEGKLGQIRAPRAKAKKKAKPKKRK